MRILVITTGYPTEKKPGEVPAIKDQVESLRQQGITIDIINIREFGKFKYLKAAWNILRLNVQRKKYDLIHSIYGHAGFIALLQFRYPVITTFQGSDLLGGKDNKEKSSNKFDGIIGRFVAQWVKGVIVMTETMKTISKREDAEVIPFGVNIEIFKPYPKLQARKELGLPADKKIILFPWDPSRRVKRYDIIRETIEILQKKMDIEVSIIFGRPREEVALYMNACDALVIASDHEGSPVAVQEALACNLPIVSVDVGDIRQTIENCAGCYLAKQDAGDLAEKIETAINLKHSRPQERPNYNQTYTSHDAADKVILVYKNMIDKK
jgi:glycosyltransferase involved in cell wall biosynthesis